MWTRKPIAETSMVTLHAPHVYHIRDMEITWEKQGLSYPELVDELIRLGFER